MFSLSFNFHLVSWPLFTCYHHLTAASKKLEDKAQSFKDLQCLARSIVVDGVPEETKNMNNSQVIDYDDIYEPTADELERYTTIMEDERIHEVTICLCTVTCKVSSNCRIKSNMFKYIIIDHYIL